MKEFDSIRIVDKGGDSVSFEMTGNVAGSPYNTIVFLLRATSGLIAASAKEDADPQKVADAFAKVFAKHVAQEIRGGRVRQAEDGKENVSKNVKINRKRLIKLTAGQFGLQIRELTDAVMGMVSVRKRQHEKSQSEAHKPAKKGGCEE